MATKIGTVEGTGAAINISTGFTPSFVLIANTEDGDIVDIWFNGMTDGTAVSISAAAATRATDGVSLFAGSATAGIGFTIGSGISESGKTLFYLALSNDPGAA